MTEQGFIRIRLLAALGAAAAAFIMDMKTGKVPNRLIIAALITAAVLPLAEAAVPAVGAAAAKQAKAAEAAEAAKQAKAAEAAEAAKPEEPEEAEQAAGEKAARAVSGVLARCFLRSAAGMLIPLLFPGILFLAGMMGAGDIKLLCAIGALLGPGAVNYMIPVSFFAGGVQALWALIRRRDGRQALRRVHGYVQTCLRTGNLPDYGQTVGNGGTVHFTGAILAAAAAYAVSCCLTGARVQ